MILTRLLSFISIKLCVLSYTKSFHKLPILPLRNLQLESTAHGLMIEKSLLGHITGYSFHSIGSPKVLPPTTTDEEWKLWFSGRNIGMSEDIADMATGRIFYLTSKDGISNWISHPDSPVLKPSKEVGDWWWFDSEHVGLGDVLVPGNNIQNKFLSIESVFLMYTFGGNSDSVNTGNRQIKGLKLEIGVAVSQDGIHWSKVEGNSAYGSIIQSGSPNDFDGQFVGWPSTLELLNEFRMYYHTYDPRSKKFVVGVAIARDGLLDWIKLGPVFNGSNNENHFDYRGVTRRHVTQWKDGKYRMWYEGISSQGQHSIGLALSNDGINWERVSDEPVFSANKDDPTAWDSGGVGSPHLVWLDDKKRWRMYYIGSSLSNLSDSIQGGGDGIGIAESTDENGMYFERVMK